ncbi:G-patch domain protein [Ceratobasidium sp. AG-Ba]|nr:G-patch domain protein [Ceratobasidium sp. AG-Ba]
MAKRGSKSSGRGGRSGRGNRGGPSGRGSRSGGGGRGGGGNRGNVRGNRSSQGAQKVTSQGRSSSITHGGGDSSRVHAQTGHRGGGPSSGVSQGQGRGFVSSPNVQEDNKITPDNQSRLLEPILFVRAQHTPLTLFEDKNEIFKPEIVDKEQGSYTIASYFVEAALAKQEVQQEVGSDLGVSTKLTGVPQGPSARELTNYLASISPVSSKPTTLKTPSTGPSTSTSSSDPTRGSGRNAPFTLSDSAAASVLTYEPKLRSFATNSGATRTMTLPVMDKDSRRQVEFLAKRFGIKVETKGQGIEQYLNLVRTSSTGSNIDEPTIRRLLRRAEHVEGEEPNAINQGDRHTADGRSGGNYGKVRIKTKDGEVVGSTAAKIGADNVGHQLLKSMGWVEGGTIGVLGGISDPLEAIMKRTKLGLGATRK